MIEIRGLSFKYKNAEKSALVGIDMSIEDGDFVGIIGASGAGKTTLLYSINAIIPHYIKGDYYGNVSIDGVDTFEKNPAEFALSVGTVMQDIDSQMVAAEVEDEILYGLENFGVAHDEIPQRISNALSLVGIEELRHREISSLSGGQKQKVAIAAITALRPKILLLDEPTGELDPQSSRQIFTMLKKLNEEQGMTIICVEQKIMLLCEFAKKLAVMEQGKLAYYNNVRTVLRNSVELEQLGINCPRVVTLSESLKAHGIGDGRVCVNIPEAAEMIGGILK